MAVFYVKPPQKKKKNLDTSSMHLYEGLKMRGHLADVRDAPFLDDSGSEAFEGGVVEDADLTLGVPAQVPAGTLARSGDLVHVCARFQEDLHDLRRERAFERAGCRKRKRLHMHARVHYTKLRYLKPVFGFFVVFSIHIPIYTVYDLRLENASKTPGGQT